MKYFFTVLFIVSSLVQLFASFKMYTKLKAFSKGFVIASLLGYYLVAADGPRPAVVMALVFSLMGDMLLIRSSWLVYGGFAFGFAHIMYIAAYWGQIDFSAIPAWAFIVAALCYAVLIFGMLRFLWPYVSKKLRVAGTAYLTNIGVMSYFALLQLLSLKSGAATLVYAGSCIFILSDFMLLIRNFHAHTNIKHKPFIVMLTYIVAQALIVWGMLRIGP